MHLIRWTPKGNVVWKGIQSVFRSFRGFLNMVAMACLIFIASLTTLDVILRYVFRKPIEGAYELTELAMSMAIFLSVAYIQFLRAHVHVDLFRMHVHGIKTNAIMDVISLIVAAAFCFFVARFAFDQIIVAIEFDERFPGDLGVPKLPGRIAIFIGLLTLGVQFIIDMGEKLKVLLKRS
jgi:TRAP-type transport system small permease protein